MDVYAETMWLRGRDRASAQCSDDSRRPDRVVLMIEIAESLYVGTLSYEAAERFMKELAAKHGYHFISGGDVACPWLVNRYGDVVAYHGFLPSFVFWKRGGAVFLIEPKEILSVLDGDSEPTSRTHKFQPRPTTQSELS